MNIDLDKVARIIKDVAHTEILPRFRNLDDTEIECKTSPDDLVTVVDGNSETELSRRLKLYIPSSKVLGEEGVYKNPNEANLVDSDGYVWIIDPLDGTKNFTKGSDNFGVIVALMKDRQTVASWIYTPLKGIMLMGEKGSGVYADTKKVVMPSYTKPLSEFNLAYDFCYANLDDYVKSLTFLWCSAVEYQMILTGELDGGFFCGFLKPWDHSAGLFMHTEMGGYNAFLDGSDYNHKSNKDQNNPLLLMPSKNLWLEAKSLIKYRPSQHCTG